MIILLMDDAIAVADRSFLEIQLNSLECFLLTANGTAERWFHKKWYILRVLAVSTSGSSCSKLTTSLVNVSLKFKTLILQIHCYFL